MLWHAIQIVGRHNRRALPMNGKLARTRSIPQRSYIMILFGNNEPILLSISPKLKSKITDILAIIRLNSRAGRRETIELWNTTFDSTNVPVKSAGSRSDP